MKKISKEIWLRSGLEQLTRHGQGALRMELLCRHLQVTKGSFYHHFKNIETYKRAILIYWEGHIPANSLAALKQNLKAEDRMQTPHERKVAGILAAEAAIRIWAVSFPMAREVLDRVDKQRLEQLRATYAAKGLPERKALDLARLEYLGLIGIPMVWTGLATPEIEGLASIFERMLRKEEKA